ncbi:MAG: sirohydrochlorin cobaltochelatase [Eggerthellaceae bacterium]|nr:sirohydrochlorin cobaltochelatase [Eggerthellaceae bacterium]
MTIRYAEPWLGEVGATATDVLADKKAVAEAITAEALSPLNYPSLDLAGKDGKIAFVFMGHGTGHDANVTYAQMQEQMDQLGYENVYIGSVESEDVGDEPRTAASIIERASAAGYKNIILRPLMVVAGDHANNDMAGDEEDSWKSMFIDSKKFDSVNCQIEGLGRIADIQKMYVDHTAAAKTVTVPTAAKNLVYNAEKQTGVAAGAGYTLSGTTSAKDAGSYKATATLESGLVWNDETTDAKQIKWSIAQAKAAAKVTKTKSLKVKSLKKKAASFTAIKLTTDGKATWKVIKNSNKKAISFKAGKVTVMKGTAKGTYTLKVQASAKAGKNYKALNAKTYKITVKVK